MAKVEIDKELKNEILRKFKGESENVFNLLKSLEGFPQKGKLLCVVNNLAIKELRYKSFRFYFLVDSFKVKFLSIKELQDLLIKFVRMSDKKSQQKVINEIKDFLRKI